jgi:hypothetical protein
MIVQDCNLNYLGSRVGDLRLEANLDKVSTRSYLEKTN